MGLANLKMVLMLCTSITISCYKSSFNSLSQSERTTEGQYSETEKEKITSQVRSDLYYYGEGRVTSLIDGSQNIEKVLIKKSTVPSEKLISEVACVVKPDGKTILSPVYLKVDVQTNMFQVSNVIDTSAPRSLTGTGTLLGEPWNWSTLRFDMAITTPRGNIIIKDSNWIVGDKLIARKEIKLSNGTPIQLWETEAQAISQTEFEKKQTELACPTNF